MTSPLVKPARGYISLSRLDSSRSRPSIWTTNRSGAIAVLLGTVLGLLVSTDPQEPREPQAAVRGAVAVPHLDHQLRTYPMGAAGILARHRAGHEWRRGCGEWRQHGQQIRLGGRA